MSGQGPYYGQAMWFNNYAPETIPYAIDRYKNEIKRVTGVLEKALEGRDWLVGDKYTYADLSFTPWQSAVPLFFSEEAFYEEFPRVKAWLDRMYSRPTLQKIFAERKAAGEAAGGKP